MGKPNNNKKIVFVGPSGSGKTSVKKVFFEMANPIKLLEEPLPPTMGCNSSIFSLFNSNFGLFDLAGQENYQWFSKEKNIFNESSVIICIFEVTDSLESIIPFIINIIMIKKEFKLRDCNIIVFLHKIDLVNTDYINLKANSIKNFFDVQFSKESIIKIYKTSISKKYFFPTYLEILDILNLIYEKKLIPLNKIEFENLRAELTIILKSDNSTKNSIQDLQLTFSITPQILKFHLERLERLGFVKISFKEVDYYTLTDRGYCFKLGLDKESEKIDETFIKKGIDFCYLLLNLNMISIKI